MRSAACFETVFPIRGGEPAELPDTGATRPPRMLSLIVIWPVRSRRAHVFAATRRPLLRSAVGNTVSASDVDLVRSQHPGEIRMQPVVAHRRQHVAQFPDHPALAAVEKGETLRGVRDGHCLVIERAE